MSVFVHIWSQIYNRIRVIFTHLKLWAAAARQLNVVKDLEKDDLADKGLTLTVLEYFDYPLQFTIKSHKWPS